jgi:hypothetical protein
MKKPKNNWKEENGGDTPSQLIDARIEELADWRGETLARLRAIIKQADPEVVEEVKWRKPSNPLGVPVWSHGGIICTGETYKEVVKLTFAKGASLADPSGLFNSSLEGNTRRAINFREGDKVDEKAMKALTWRAASQSSRWTRFIWRSSTRQIRRAMFTRSCASRAKSIALRRCSDAGPRVIGEIRLAESRAARARDVRVMRTFAHPPARSKGKCARVLTNDDIAAICGRAVLEQAAAQNRTGERKR